MFDLSSFIPDEKQDSRLFSSGTCIMELDGVCKRVTASISRNLHQFDGNQPLIQTCLGARELEAVYQDGTIDVAEYREYIGSDPIFSTRHNQSNPRQKKVEKYRFTSKG